MDKTRIVAVEIISAMDFGRMLEINDPDLELAKNPNGETVILHHRDYGTVEYRARHDA